MHLQYIRVSFPQILWGRLSNCICGKTQAYLICSPSNLSNFFFKKQFSFKPGFSVSRILTVSKQIASEVMNNTTTNVKKKKTSIVKTSAISKWYNCNIKDSPIFCQILIFCFLINQSFNRHLLALSTHLLFFPHELHIYFDILNI